jgi:branched-chain amino acid transport system substrate-binding protein
MTPGIHRAARRITQALQVACCIVSASCAFPGAVRPTLKIGLVAPFEGRYRPIGYDVIYAVRLALQEANGSGGVAGYAVELVAYDDGAQPAMADEQARKLSVDPDVLAAVGHFREETTHAAAGVYARAGLPLVAPAVLDPHLIQGQDVLYQLGPPAPVLATALLDRAAWLTGSASDRAQGEAHIVLLGGDGPLGASLQDLARDEWLEEPGLGFSTVSADAVDWQAEVLAHHPAVVLCDLDPVRAGEVVAALRQAGWSGDVLGGPALAASDFVAVAGQAAQGATFLTPWPFPPDVAGGEPFADAYRSVSNGLEPGPLALPAYEATWLLLEALGGALAEGDPTRQAVSAALAQVERDGVLGHVAFDRERVWSGESLYWYRLAAEGVPRLVETVRVVAPATLAERPLPGEGG